MELEERIDELLARLDLEEIDFNIFRGQNEAERKGRLFGGQVAAQSLVAAGRTVGDGNRHAHSLHAYFLRPGDPTWPVVYSVDRIRDGRSFTTRRVVAQQRGKAIFNMAVSFHDNEPGYEHQMAMPADAPDPDAMPTWDETLRKALAEFPEETRGFTPHPRPVEMRHSLAPTFLGGERTQDPNHVWMRLQRRLPDEPFLHQCLLTYITDYSLLDNVVRPHGRIGELGPLMTASLDHAIWFHRPCRVDEWLLYYQDTPAAAGARGFARGTIYTRDGTLVASVAQEGLMRPVSKPEDRTS